MTNLLNTKVLLSGAMIVAAAAVVIGATFAFFSDTETSADNTFTAGSIDLTLGGAFSSEFNGSSPFDIDPQDENNTLYNFTDLKPGDMGEGSFDLEVTSNEAYVCALSTITSTPENVRIDPEAEAGDVTDGEGELQNYLQLATFDDENENNLYDDGEPVNVNQYLGGDGNGFTVAQVAAAGWVSVADPTTPNTWLTTGSLLSGDPQNAGLLYCFGDFTTSGADENTVVTGCDGTDADQNLAQTDQVVGSIEFYAVQTRNNDEFTCASLNE